MQLIILALVFLGTIGVMVGAYVYVNRRRLSAADAALERLREADVVAADRASVRGILRDVSVSDLPAFDRILAGKDLTARITELLQKAGDSSTPGSLLLRAAVIGAVGFLLVEWWTQSLLFSVVALALGVAFPFWRLLARKQAREKRFQDQLPDAIDMLVSAMKAGYSFQAAMKFIGEEIGDPLGPEFSRFYEEQRLGMDVRAALLMLQARVDSLDLKMLVTAILIQRETGGNLSEVLEKISGLMRERAAIKGEIETLTAESKMSARVLGALPFVVYGLINLVNPGFAKPMMETSWGPILLLLAAISVAFGYSVMMKIADVDI